MVPARKWILTLLAGFCSVLGHFAFVQGQTRQPSLVSLEGRRLMVQKRNPDGTLQPPSPYTVKGVNWSPASEDTTAATEDRRTEFAQWHLIDIPLMKAMNVNTARVYLDLDVVPMAMGLEILDEFYENDIMVIMTVDDAVNDLNRVQQAVSFYKDHPAILFWMLGSEWNINFYFGAPGCSTPLLAAQCTQQATQLIKTLDTNHPVAASYGDIDIDDAGRRLEDTSNYVNNICTSVDIWALNIFRGETFGDLFDQWRSISGKPMMLGEFGTDALRRPSGLVDETMQAHWNLRQWHDIIPQLSARHPALAALGGLIFEWNDEWWKVPPPGVHNSGGFSFPGAHPDDFAHEEYFGIVDIDRQPRLIHSIFAEAFADHYVRPPRGEVFGAVSRGALASQFGGQLGVARFYKSGRLFYDESGGAGGGRGFNVVALDPVHGSQVSSPRNFDTWGTRHSCRTDQPDAAFSALADHLNTIPDGSLIMIAVADDAGLNQDNSCNPLGSSACFDQGFAALHALGSTLIGDYCFRNSWALISVKGEGAVAEGLADGDFVSLMSGLPDPGAFRLTLDKASAGPGAVSTAPSGISCGSLCRGASADFGTNTLLELQAAADPGARFAGWSGDADCSDGVVLVDAEKSCLAAFDLQPLLDTLVSGDLDGNGVDDLAGLTCNGRIFYTLDLMTWTQLPGTLKHLAVGDFDGNGSDDLAGVNAQGEIMKTTDLMSWTTIPGRLSHLVSGDFNGDLQDDLAGLTDDGRIFFTTDMQNWTQIAGNLARLIVGEFNGDILDDLAGLTLDGRIFFTTDRVGWNPIGGRLQQLIAWDSDGLQTTDLAGLATDGRIFFSTDRATWTQIPGTLARLSHGDYDGNAIDDLSGLAADGRIFCSIDHLTWNQVWGTLARLARVPNRPGLPRSQYGGAFPDDLAGLAPDGRIFLTTNKMVWAQVPGTLCPNLK